MKIDKIVEPIESESGMRKMVMSTAGDGYLIGLDFGSESARGVLLEAESGRVVGSLTHDYRHGVMSASLPGGEALTRGWALQVATDYTEAAEVILAGLGRGRRVLGIGLGLIFGVSIRHALSDQGVSVLSVPAGQLAVFVLLAALIGLQQSSLAEQPWPTARLAGGLLTFSKGHSLNDLPAYDHAQPGPCFARLDGLIRELLDTVISTRYFAIALAQPKPAFHAGRLDSDKIDGNTAFFLSVSAALPQSEIIESVPLRLKLGAPDDVEKLVLSAMAGVRLRHAAQVPAAIPVRPGACYFALDAHGPLYDRMLKAQSIMIYTPESYPDLKLELIAITP